MRAQTRQVPARTGGRMRVVLHEVQLGQTLLPGVRDSIRPPELIVPGMCDGAFVISERYRSLSEMWLSLVPEYRSKAYVPLHVSFPWDRAVAEEMWKISPKRCEKRMRSYVIPGELERSDGSIRFGHSKTGRGYHGNKRGDFCLVAGVYGKGQLTVFYRALELIGGFHFDLPLYAAVEDVMGPIKRVNIFAVRAFVFGVKGVKSMTKERLYEQMREHHVGRV